MIVRFLCPLDHSSAGKWAYAYADALVRAEINTVLVGMGPSPTLFGGGGDRLSPWAKLGALLTKPWSGDFTNLVLGHESDYRSGWTRGASTARNVAIVWTELGDATRLVADKFAAMRGRPEPAMSLEAVFARYDTLIAAHADLADLYQRIHPHVVVIPPSHPDEPLSDLARGHVRSTELSLREVLL